MDLSYASPTLSFFFVCFHRVSYSLFCPYEYSFNFRYILNDLLPISTYPSISPSISLFAIGRNSPSLFVV